MSPTPERSTSIRLTDDILHRADRLVEVLAKDPATVALTGAAGPTRAGVLRLAIVRGLEVLEDLHGLAPPS